MTSSDKIDMDPELAKYLVDHGGTLVVTRVPSGTDFGVDLKSWTTGDNFKGIKMIPPGFHFFHYSATNEFGELAPRVGFFHIFQPKEVIVKEWDDQEENISTKVIKEEMLDGFKSNLKNLDKFLGPYPYDVWEAWKKLTSKIDVDLMKRCQPLCGFFRSVVELENCDDTARIRGSHPKKEPRRKSGLSVDAKEELLLPDLKPKAGTALRLIELPTRNYPDNATPTEITQHSLDSSYALNHVIHQMNQSMEIIGELQLSFICFLVGQSLDAFEHWKKLIALMCGADKAILECRSIYVEFLCSLEIQLTHVPEDVLCDIVASSNFVYYHLRKLFATIEMTSEIDGRLKSEAARMRQRLTTKFLWDFSHLREDEEDELPVVVSTQ